MYSPIFDIFGPHFCARSGEFKVGDVVEFEGTPIKLTEILWETDLMVRWKYVLAEDV